MNKFIIMLFLGLLIFAFIFITFYAQHFIYRYRRLFYNLYAFLALYAIDLLLSYYLDFNIVLMNIFLFAYIILIFLIYRYTKKFGILPFETIVFLELISFGFLIYMFNPIFMAFTASLPISLTLLTGLWVLIIFIGIIIYALSLKNFGIRFFEIWHIILASFIFLFLGLLKYFIGGFTFFNVFIWYFFAILFEGILEFMTHLPTILHIPYHSKNMQWFWIIALLVVGILIIL